MASHQTEEQRQEVGCAVEPDAKNEAKPARDKKVAVPERGKIDEGRGVTLAAPERNAAAHGAYPHQSQRRGITPATPRRFAQHPLQGSQKTASSGTAVRSTAPKYRQFGRSTRTAAIAISATAIPGGRLTRNR